MRDSLSNRRRQAFTLIELLVVIAIMAVMLGLLLPAVQKVRGVTIRLRCQHNLRQIGIAMHNFQVQMGHFPSGYLHNPETTGPNLTRARLRRAFDRPPDALFTASYDPGWGWATLLLPYLEQDTLYRRIDLSLPCSSPSFESVREVPIGVYTCPADQPTGHFWVLSREGNRLAGAATNSYVGVYGQNIFLAIEPDKGDGMFFQNSKVRVTDVTDGLSNTLAITERASFFAQGPWVGAITGGTIRHTPGAPVYRTVALPPSVMPLARVGRRSLHHNFSEPYDFWSPHGNYFVGLFADGAVHTFRQNIQARPLQALATRAGGEVISEGEWQ